ncbi:hypothetical protein NA56DRAFT_754082 [Hyaloscypha hepaticicola]|uniref:Uncharacterized protein n=1 Tax=Hyaloscypha hepaticicola TaxID=2082293 RepID=A0A2J6PMU2_9HELO|nr:hypothetical protein NA56DRAFT_754082 [Hyaloscypha hepaticicola]
MLIRCFEEFSIEGFTIDSGFSPCGNLNSTTTSLPCCGGNDTCMTGGFCYHAYSAFEETGYYVQGYTAGNLDDPNCLSRCVDMARPDVIWNSTTNLWQCCGADASGYPQFNDPTDNTFAAPALSALIPYFTIISGFTSTSTSIISTSASTGSSTPSVASHSATPPSSSARLSTGAIAGIAVGCGLAGIIFGVVTIVLLFRRRAVRRTHGLEVVPQFNQQRITSHIK